MYYGTSRREHLYSSDTQSDALDRKTILICHESSPSKRPSSTSSLTRSKGLFSHRTLGVPCPLIPLRGDRKWMSLAPGNDDNRSSASQRGCPCVSRRKSGLALLQSAPIPQSGLLYVCRYCMCLKLEKKTWRGVINIWSLNLHGQVTSLRPDGRLLLNNSSSDLSHRAHSTLKASAWN